MAKKDSMLIYDTFILNTPSINDGKSREFISDASLSEGRSLLVRIAASHWGYVNKNGFWYDPETIDGSIPTWTEPYRKPVLPFHPKSEDAEIPPLGRILGATYREGIAKTFVQDDVVPDNKPHGYLEFLTRISDVESIPMVIDGRYDTVSISANAVNVTCSVCGEKVATDDSTCSHQRLRRYDKEGSRDSDGSSCYYKAGPLLGRHLAFVLNPSDVYAGVQTAELEGQSVSDMVNTESAWMELFVLNDSEKLLLNLHDDSSDNLFDSITAERRSVIFDMIDMDSRTKNGEEVNIVDKLNSDEIIGMTDAAIEVALTEDKLTDDAKLTAGARKKLPDSAFCGPDRSFPAHDAAHVRNGLARLNQSSLSGSAKKSTLTCLRRRASKHGIKVSAKVRDTADEYVIDEITVGDIILADASLEDILALAITEGHLVDTKEPTENPAEDSTLSDTLAVRDAEIISLTSSKSELQKDMKSMTVERIIDMKLYLKEIDPEKVDEERAKYNERSEDSLKDTIKDMRTTLEAGMPLKIEGKAQRRSVDGGGDPHAVTDGPFNKSDKQRRNAFPEAYQNTE